MTGTKQKLPTLAEYTDIIKKDLERSLSNLSDAEFDRYMRDKETIDMIKQSYERAETEYEAGRITYDEVVIGSASSVSYALDLMY